ncbi:long-chain fatty acid-CoA ligase [Mycoemilia scoparia]|uniref:Long-chain fatty acid-CoA ligase n=1 Tax=Mycoemilia scoparia TaxID=417184 RepID=A0A9W7ZQC2_9FUNG|nr:long-chain fatty acid-CoA ligase [Mycoemilia scoparia]
MAPKQWSVIVDKDQRIRRSTFSTKKLVDSAFFASSSSEQVQTLYGVLEHSAKILGSKQAFGQRDLIDTIVEEKEITKTVNNEQVKETKKWSYFKLSPYKWLTYTQALEFANSLGSGFRNLGLEKGSRVLICAPTSKEWILTAFACASQSMEVVTAYDTLGEDGLKHATALADVGVMFLKTEKLPMAARIAATGTGTPPSDDDADGKKAQCEKQDGADIRNHLKHVVHYGPIEKGHQEAIDKIKSLGIEVHTLDEIVALGKEKPFEPVPPKPDDIGLVMFTSGSTGEPKGALISHKNIVSVSGGIELFIAPFIEPQTDTLLCYLPLAHILELMVEVYAVSKGIRIGYGSVKTLTNDNVRECEGDLLTLKPSIMIGVPLVWDSIRAGVERKVKAKGGLTQKIFKAAVNTKTFLRRNGLPSGFVDIVFGEVSKVTGGNLKFIITGGAPISDYSQKLLSAALCPMIQGYGMTECSGLISVQTPDDTTLKSVGPPVPSIEVKLADVPEMDYYAKNDQGEIWLRGPSIFKGYLKNQEETDKVMTKDGWLKTGDIGEWLSNGQLSIIDRVKNLVKLAQGEYVALEKLESIYKLSLYVDNICICANSELTQPVAIVVPNQPVLISWAKNNNISFNDDFAELARMPAIKKFILGDLIAVAKKKQLAKFETLSDIVVEDGEWTPENGLVTAAQKLKRRDIHNRHKDKLDAIYSKSSS